MKLKVGGVSASSGNAGKMLSVKLTLLCCPAYTPEASLESNSFYHIVTTLSCQPTVIFLSPVFCL